MPVYLITFTQNKSGKAKPTIWKHRVFYDKGVDTLAIAFYAGSYIANLISSPSPPGWYWYSIDEMLSSYPINIEISFINTVRKFILKETKSEVNKFVKANDKFYTIIDQETEKPIALSRDMFYQYSKKILFDIKDSLPQDKRPTPEILTPIGGAVKKK